MMSKISEPKIMAEMSYEEAFKELTALVESLESNEHPLDETMRLFERGQELSKHCADLLAGAELKVRQLNGESMLEMDMD
jgi:exodeoxyribonuclease VII small subunit